MRELAQLLQNYALFGATAQMRYTEPVATLDADVLVVLPAPDRIDALNGIYKFCATKSLRPEGEAIRVGAWPEKIRMAERIRSSVERWRLMAGKGAVAPDSQSDRQE